MTPPVDPPVVVPADATKLTVGMGLRSGITYTGAITGAANHATQHGAWTEGAQGTKVLSASVTGFQFGLALWGASKLLVQDLIGRACLICVYGSGVVDSDLDNLDLASDSTKTTDHAIYLSSECSGVRGKDWRLVSGAGYALHLYCETGSSQGLTVDGLYMDARAGLYPAVFHNWSGVRLTNVESYSNRAHFSLWDCSDIVVENFHAEGGTALVQLVSGRTARNVIFRNGTYKGPRLTQTGQPIPGVTLENVSLI